MASSNPDPSLLGSWGLGRVAASSAETPLDAVDLALTAGGALGLLTYVGGLLLGDVGTATVGVWVGVACVLTTLSLRGLRAVA